MDASCACALLVWVSVLARESGGSALMVWRGALSLLGLSGERLRSSGI